MNKLEKLAILGLGLVGLLGCSNQDKIKEETLRDIVIMNYGKDYVLNKKKYEEYIKDFIQSTKKNPERFEFFYKDIKSTPLEEFAREVEEVNSKYNPDIFSNERMVRTQTLKEYIGSLLHYKKLGEKYKTPSELIKACLAEDGIKVDEGATSFLEFIDFLSKTKIIRSEELEKMKTLEK